MLVCKWDRGHDDEYRSKKHWQMQTHLPPLFHPFECFLAFGRAQFLFFSLPVALVHPVAVEPLEHVEGLDGADAERDRNGAHLKWKN
jgi:hypothetical protein